MSIVEIAEKLENYITCPLCGVVFDRRVAPELFVDTRQEELEFKIWDEDTTVSYKSNIEKNKQIVEKIIEWCKKYNVSSGESLMQRDDPVIEAPVLIAEIIDDILEFE